MRETEAQIVAALVRWAPPDRREWNAYVWRSIDGTTPPLVGSQARFVYVVRQWGRETWMRDQWRLDTWADVRTLAGVIGRDWYWTLDWRGRLDTAQRQIGRWWTWLRRVPCEALDSDGAPCSSRGYLSVGIHGGDAQWEIRRLCDAHADSLLRIHMTVRFRDGSALTTGSITGVDIEPWREDSDAREAWEQAREKGV